MRSSRLLLSRLAIGAMTVLLMFCLSHAGKADIITWTFTGSKAPEIPVTTANALSAKVEFTYDSVLKTLKVVLTNTADDVDYQNEVLTGVFFDAIGNPLTIGDGWVKGTAVTGGEVIQGNHSPDQILFGAGKDVSSEWAFASTAELVPPDAAIGSSGFGIFGPQDRFDTTTNLDGPDDPNGINYGIVDSDWLYSDGDDNNKLGVEPVIRGSVIFTFSNVKTPFSDPTLSFISNVNFQYGTDLGDPSVPGDFNKKPPQVPEPATIIALLGMTLTGVGFRFTRRMRPK